jgi:hypothetical protein
MVGGTNATGIFECDNVLLYAARIHGEAAPDICRIDEPAPDIGRIGGIQTLTNPANERAEALLLSHLTPVQIAEYKRDMTFVVHGPNGLRYRIRRGKGATGLPAANVDVIGADGYVRERLCCHPQDQVPVADAVLAQLLWLRADPMEFHRVANVHPRLTAARVLDAL